VGTTGTSAYIQSTNPATLSHFVALPLLIAVLGMVFLLRHPKNSQKVTRDDREKQIASFGTHVPHRMAQVKPTLRNVNNKISTMLPHFPFSSAFPFVSPPRVRQLSPSYRGNTPTCAAFAFFRGLQLLPLPPPPAPSRLLAL
jgi:hypothetical protein